MLRYQDCPDLSWANLDWSRLRSAQARIGTSPPIVLSTDALLKCLEEQRYNLPLMPYASPARAIYLSVENADCENMLIIAGEQGQPQIWRVWPRLQQLQQMFLSDKLDGRYVMTVLTTAWPKLSF